MAELADKAPVRPPTFWDTRQGDAVLKRYRAWANWVLGGGVMDSTGTGNGVQGNPGDMPAGWHLAMDVEITLKEWGVSRVGSYIIHVHGKGERAETVQDVLLTRVMAGLYKNPIEFEREIGRVVDRALVQFGRFMAEKRGL